MATKKKELLIENERLKAELAQREQKLGEQEKQFQDQESAYAELQRENESLQLEVKKLLERLFGSRSEKYIDDPEQLKLDFGSDDPQVDDAVEGLVIATDGNDGLARSVLRRTTDYPHTSLAKSSMLISPTRRKRA